ncbi:MAG: ABC transporter ATP-binding protein [Pseudomonadota bacterium]
MNGILKVENLGVKRGGIPVLDIPSLDLQESEVLSLIGPNGTGKSSLLLTLAGLLTPESGRILFRNQPLSSPKELLAYRRRTAMVFQEALLLDTTVFNNVASGLKIRGRGRAEINSRVDYYLNRFCIEKLASRSAHKLSGGEAQRTSLARALAVQPEILFLDEPFSALDPPTREALIDDFVSILGETKMSVIMATHDIGEALRISGKMAVMNQGRITQMGLGEEIIERPANRFVASFVKTETLLPGRVTKSAQGRIEIAVAGKSILALGDQGPDQDVICCIRPERVTLSIDTVSRNSAENHFPARIERVQALGFFYRVQLDCGFPLVAYIPKQTRERLKLEKDESVGAHFSASAVHVLSDQENTTNRPVL